MFGNAGPWLSQLPHYPGGGNIKGVEMGRKSLSTILLLPPPTFFLPPQELPRRLGRGSESLLPFQGQAVDSALPTSVYWGLLT